MGGDWASWMLNYADAVVLAVSGERVRIVSSRRDLDFGVSLLQAMNKRDGGAT